MSGMDDPYPARDAEEEARRQRRGLFARLLAPLLVLVGLAVKFGAFSLKFFGIFISVGGYALIWGWRFAVGFVLLILVHELGHYIEAKRLGLDPALPVFVPFLGAYVALRNAPFDPWRNARVSLAGPILGGRRRTRGAAGRGGAQRRLPARARVHGLLPQSGQPRAVRAARRRARAARLAGAAPRRRSVRCTATRSGSAASSRLLRLLTVALLAAGMLAAHVPQTRL